MQFSIFSSPPWAITPFPLLHPTLALPRLRGREKTDRAGPENCLTLDRNSHHMSVGDHRRQG